MSRIRSIKPEFWTSAQILECSRNARLAFIGLWNFCDDCGRHAASVKQLKAELFAGDRVSIGVVGRWVQELIDAGLIRSYVVGTQGVWQVTGWHHQRIDKPQPQRYPAEHSTNDPGAFPPDTIRNETKRYDPIGNDIKTFDRTNVRSFLSDGGNEDTTWGAVKERCRPLVLDIHAAWDTPETYYPDGSQRDPMEKWRMPAEFRDKLLRAALCVELGILPAEWLTGVVAVMLDGGKRKAKPAAWLGKVLAERAREDHNVDWDSYRRVIKIPEGLFEEKPDV